MSHAADPALDLIRRSAALTVPDLFRQQARRFPDRIALEDERIRRSYGEVNARVNRLANGLADLGIGPGERIALLSENRPEYLEIVLAASVLGAIVCCLNWRLSDPELEHCITLTTPALLIASDRFVEALERLDHGVERRLVLGPAFEALIAEGPETPPPIAAAPEDGLLILYTSGTTGLPKGALISHRAELARMTVACAEFDLEPGDTFVAWPPMFHMASTDQSLSVLCQGGRVIAVDGFQVERLVDLLIAERQWWFIVMPGMVEPVIGELRRRNAPLAGVKLIGAMADLVPLRQIEEISALVNAPYMNTFGATETGLPPASTGRLPIGEVPASLSKTQAIFCEYKLVDGDDNEVPDSVPGELAFRGPTVFSGYWNAPETNARDFRGGWFHMGDAFVRNPDGTLDFVDRVKYMIKSGGENIYPAEIERIVLADPRVDDAVVVRQRDDKWGEVPVIFIARNDDSLDEAEVERMCRGGLASYKRPKAAHFVALDDLPRSTTGKIQRHEVERWLDDAR